jgi:putative oxidoreductase
MMNSSAITSAASAAPGELTRLQGALELAGRILLCAMFLISGVGKVGSYAATVDYMSAAGVPGALLPLVIATEVFGAIAIIVGWKTRIAAFLLAGFTLLAALFFHNKLGDQIQTLMFLKDVSISGAFLLLVAHGAGPLSIDTRLRRNSLQA